MGQIPPGNRKHLKRWLLSQLMRMYRAVSLQREARVRPATTQGLQDTATETALPTGQDAVTTGMSMGYTGEQGDGGGTEESVRTLNTGANQYSKYGREIWGLERIGVGLRWTRDTGFSECGVTVNENIGSLLRLFLVNTAHMVLCPLRGEGEGCA